MARWRGYALARITPHFDWAQAPAHAQAPTVLDRVLKRTVAFPIDTHGDSRFALQLNARDTAISFAHARDDGTSGAPLLDIFGARPFSGSLTKPGIIAHFGRAGHVGAAVVLAHQRFAAPMLDGYNYPLRMPDSGVAALSQTSYGAGLEVKVGDALLPKLHWYASYRSRINMDAFQNYRGIYGKPGDLDVPAQARLGLAWLASPQTQLRLGVDRVMYSTTTPFVSASLPRRLLAVLGDASSPEFRWRDLDIYSAALSHQVNAVSRWSVRYSTGEQPRPTSALLDRVLMQDAAHYALALSYSRDVGNGQWHLVANYAPAEFVLGIPGSPRLNQQGGGRQVEFEALWTMAF